MRLKDKDWITVKEAMEIGRVSAPSITRFAKRGAIKSVKVKGRRFVKKREIYIISYWPKLRRVLTENMIHYKTCDFLNTLGKGVDGVVKIGGTHYWNPMHIDVFFEWYNNPKRMKRDWFCMRKMLNSKMLGDFISVNKKHAMDLMRFGKIKATRNNGNWYCTKKEAEKYKLRLTSD